MSSPPPWSPPAPSSACSPCPWPGWSGQSGVSNGGPGSFLPQSIVGPSTGGLDFVGHWVGFGSCPAANYLLRVQVGQEHGVEGGEEADDDDGVVSNL